MNTYNFIIIDGKVISDYLNLTEASFLEKLWEWTYEDDLWDILDEAKYYDKDSITDMIIKFIEDNVLHKYEDDDVSCFAFVNTGSKIQEYQIEKNLIDFVKSKIKEHYD